MENVVITFSFPLSFYKLFRGQLMLTFGQIRQ